MQTQVQRRVMTSAWPLRIKTETMVLNDDGQDAPRTRPPVTEKYQHVFLSGTLLGDCGAESFDLENVTISGAFSRRLDRLKGSQLKVQFGPELATRVQHLRQRDSISLDCQVIGSTSVLDRGSEWAACTIANRIFWMSRSAP
jgi:hypothetical protein